MLLELTSHNKTLTMWPRPRGSASALVRVSMSSRLRLVQADFGAGKVGIESTSVSAGFRAIGRRAELLGGEKLGGRSCVPSVGLWQAAGSWRVSSGMLAGLASRLSSAACGGSAAGEWEAGERLLLLALTCRRRAR